MKINKLFYACLALGFAFGIGSVILMDGLVGDASLENAIPIFLVCSGISTLGIKSILKKIYPMWNFNLPTVVQPNKPDECFTCNETGCKECEVLEKWRTI